MESCKILQNTPVFKDNNADDDRNLGIEVSVDECVAIQIGDRWINFYSEEDVDKLIRKLKKYKRKADYSI